MIKIIKFQLFYLLVLGVIGISATDINKDTQDVLMYTQLNNAIHSNNATVVEELVRKFDIDVNKTIYNKYTLLTIACMAGKYEVVEILLKLDANPNLHDPIFYSIIKGDEKINTLLLRHGAKLKSEWLSCCPAIAIDPEYVKDVVGKRNS